MSESLPMLSLQRPAPSLLATALALALASPAAFAETASDAQTKDLEAVVVTASPLKGNAESVATPVDVLYGEDLDKTKAGTLGEGRLNDALEAYGRRQPRPASGG